jgi:hypothetical protein
VLSKNKQIFNLPVKILSGSGDPDVLNLCSPFHRAGGKKIKKLGLSTPVSRQEMVPPILAG